MVEKKNLNSKIFDATKWATITQVATKLISPITNMILARILAPEAFGVIASVTMVTSFADMFTDSGFQKFIIQREFENETEKNQFTNIAFLVNLSISILLWVTITVFRHPLSYMIGSPKLGNVLAIASFQVILTSFSSIQMALFRREFKYKTLFQVQIISICIPFVVTVPLAFAGFSYWSLIIGTILIQISNAILLTLKSDWKPNFYFNLDKLKIMWSYSLWSLFEAISIWFTTWIDIFIIGSYLTQYDLGLFKTSISMVNTIMALITASTAPILFSALSRLQNNNNQFLTMFLRFQRLVSIVIFPLGIGIFLYSDVATFMLLGENWIEASSIIGIWALTSSFMIVFGNYSSELYRAKGNPRLSFIAQLLHLAFLIPVCIVSIRYGFWYFVYARSLARFQFVFIHLFIMKNIIKVPMLKIFNNIKPSLFSALSMGIVGVVTRNFSGSLFWKMSSIVLCIIFYFTLIYLNKNLKNEIFYFLKKSPLKKFISN